MTCSICAEDFTAERRKKVECPGCEIEVCRECVRRYLTGENIVEDPHCMGCRTAWQQVHVLNAVGKSYSTKDIVQHRKRVLLARSKANIPRVQEYATARRDFPLIQTKLNEQREKLRQKHQLERLELETVTLKDDIAEFRRLSRIINGTNGSETRERAAFVHKCSAENCEGFLSSGWKCGVCNTFTCNECGKNIGEHSKNSANCEHMCEASDVETFRLVRSTCKPCPNCATQIHKIDGCDQMWCTQCQTPFSWRTGQRIGGTVHNPHFFEWARRGGRAIQPQNGPCGGVPDAFSLTHAVNRVFPDNTIGSVAYVVSKVFRLREHFMNVDVPSLRRVVNEDVDRDLLAKYIVREITEHEFASKLQIVDKKRRFTRELLEIYDTVGTVLMDQSRRVVATGDGRGGGAHSLAEESRVEILKVLVEVVDFCKYIVGQSEEINTTYKYTRNNLKESLEELQYCVTWAFYNCEYEKPDSWDLAWPPNNLRPLPNENWLPAGFARRRRYYGRY